MSIEVSGTHAFAQQVNWQAKAFRAALTGCHQVELLIRGVKVKPACEYVHLANHFSSARNDLINLC